MLVYVGLTMLPRLAAFHVRYIGDEAPAECLERYRLHLRGLDGLAPLVFSTVEHFDEELLPKASVRIGSGAVSLPPTNWAPCESATWRLLEPGRFTTPRRSSRMMAA